ncbi:MAG: hypothetical protein U0931_39880 [Vulcanimicrobiota bacterium]
MFIGGRSASQGPPSWPGGLQKDWIVWIDMRVREFFWESEIVYGEYFNSDIAEFKRTRSEVRVRQAVRGAQRAVARQGLTLGLFGGDGGALLDKTPTHRFFEDYRFDQMALSPDEQLLAVGAGHQVQYVKLEGNRFMPTGRLGGEKNVEARMSELCFLDNERCLAISDRARLLFERGNCLSSHPLDGSRIRLAGPWALEASAGVVRLYRAAEWELVEEWPVSNARVLALSPSGSAAWVEDNGFHVRQGGVELEVGRLPPSPLPADLVFGGRRLFLREGESKVWQWRPEHPVWRDWDGGQFLGGCGDWWLAQSEAGFQSFCDE